MAPAASILLSRLRAETAKEHESVERALDVLRPSFDPAAYRGLIQGFYGIFAAWEPAAERETVTLLPGFLKTRRKLPLLRRDLTNLAMAENGIAVCHALGGPATAAQVMGAAYVFEGSTLGGQVLSRHFEKKLGITSANGGAFFAGYGERTGAMWAEFRSTLEAFADRTNSGDEIVRSAQTTFREVEEWLSRPRRM